MIYFCGQNLSDAIIKERCSERTDTHWGVRKPCPNVRGGGIRCMAHCRAGYYPHADSQDLQNIAELSSPPPSHSASVHQRVGRYAVFQGTAKALHFTQSRSIPQFGWSMYFYILESRS